MHTVSCAVCVLVALVVVLVLVDALIVALVLLLILVEMNMMVSGVVAIVGVYVLVLVAAILPVEWLVQRFGPLLVGVIGFGVFAVALVACAFADSLGLLLVFRGIQVAGVVVGLLVAFDILDVGLFAHGCWLWLGVVLVGMVAGLVLGGALIEVFDWCAIFVV